jgi:hypothetical protein
VSAPDKAGLVRRRLYHDMLYRLFGYSLFGRLPDVNNAVFLTLIDDPQPWEENTRGAIIKPAIWMRDFIPSPVSR